MARLHLDAYLFAPPTAEMGVPATDEFVESILQWGMLNPRGWVDVHGTAEIITILMKAGMWPPQVRLRHTISALGIRNIQVKDVTKLMYSLMQVRAIEDRLNVQDVLIDQAECDPGAFLTERPIEFIEHFHRLLMLVYMQEARDEVRPSCQSIIITRGIGPDYLTARYHAYLAETDPRDPLWEGQIVESQLDFCCSMRGLIHVVDPLVLWMRARGPEARENAVRIAVKKHALMNGGAIDSPPPWSLGHRFMETAEALGFLHEEVKAQMLLRAMTETILGMNLGHTHALREGKGPNEPQRMRGVDKAWRRDIDREYRLHYWMTKSGPEFASVVVHNDMSIPD